MKKYQKSVTFQPIALHQKSILQTRVESTIAIIEKFFGTPIKGSGVMITII